MSGFGIGLVCNNVYSPVLQIRCGPYFKSPGDFPVSGNVEIDALPKDITYYGNNACEWC